MGRQGEGDGQQWVEGGNSAVRGVVGAIVGDMAI